jgi:hypothetical protein
LLVDGTVRSSVRAHAAGTFVERFVCRGGVDSARPLFWRLEDGRRRVYGHDVLLHGPWSVVDERGNEFVGAPSRRGWDGLGTSSRAPIDPTDTPRDRLLGATQRSAEWRLHTEPIDLRPVGDTTDCAANETTSDPADEQDDDRADELRKEVNDSPAGLLQVLWKGRCTGLQQLGG